MALATTNQLWVLNRAGRIVLLPAGEKVEPVSKGQADAGIKEGMMAAQPVPAKAWCECPAKTPARYVGDGSAYCNACELEVEPVVLGIPTSISAHEGS